MLPDFALIAPEALLIIISLTMQMVSVFLPKNNKQIIIATLIVLVAVIALMLLFAPEGSAHDSTIIGFANSFIISKTIIFFKALILSLTIFAIIIYYNFTISSGKLIKIEFITLVLLSTLGIFISISAMDLLLLFCGLELQAIIGYVLAAFNIKKLQSSESGLKYFIFGSLSSVIMLLGISFIYGFSGDIGLLKTESSALSIGLTSGRVLILIALLFKLSAAPLHFWTPDVYEGSPLTALTYFATAQKIGLVLVLINYISSNAGNSIETLELVKFSAILSMIVGAFGGIRQIKIKKIIAYSTILNTGYILTGLYLNTPDAILAATDYVIVYAITMAGFLTCLAIIFPKKDAIEDTIELEDFKILTLTSKPMAATMAIIIFSLIGIPPLAGFLAKYNLFYQTIAQDNWLLAGIGVFSNVVSAFYYLRIIKFMYFESNAENKPVSNMIPTSYGLLFVYSFSLAFILFYFLLPLSYIL